MYFIFLLSSSYGQNLSTSTYIGETSFAILISILGLVLFAHLIGNMQVLENVLLFWISSSCFIVFSYSLSEINWRHLFHGVCSCRFILKIYQSPSSSQICTIMLHIESFFNHSWFNQKMLSILVWLVGSFWRRGWCIVGLDGFVATMIFFIKPCCHIVKVLFFNWNFKCDICSSLGKLGV